MTEEREKTAQAVAAAEAAWAKAPMHIKAMAGAYVGPLMVALKALNDELNHSLGLKKTEP